MSGLIHQVGSLDYQIGAQREGGDRVPNQGQSHTQLLRLHGQVLDSMGTDPSPGCERQLLFLWRTDLRAPFDDDTGHRRHRPEVILDVKVSYRLANGFSVYANLRNVVMTEREFGFSDEIRGTFLLGVRYEH